MSNQLTTAVRTYPQKPEAPAAFNASKTTDVESSLNILKAFYTEARRELKKNASVAVNGEVYNDASQLHFMTNDFELILTFVERS